MRAVRPAAWALAAIVLGATLLRLYVFSAGPDLDTDAYGHAVLGRYTWDDPGNLQIHWVWLPLWHFFFGFVGWLGLGFQSVRLFDIALSALVPVLVYRTVQDARREPDALVAVLAALFAAFFPIAITHGQSGEPEALFAVLILSAAWCIERDRRVLASVPLGVAVLLRFEAWAVLPAFAVASVLLARSPRRLLRGGVAVILPGLVIVAYVVLHWQAYDGRWLVFLRENHAFVQEARTHAVPGQGPQPVWYWYVAALPFRTAGPVVVLALVGLWRFFRHAPITYRVVGPWLLAFVSYGWVREQHLGLDRHFFAVVPFFAVAMAEGGVLVARWLGGQLAARFGARAGTVGLVATLVVAACGLLGFSMHHARAHAQAAVHAFEPERRMAAAVVNQAPAAGSVYCSSGKVEVLSGLGRDRFGGADAVRARGASGAPVVVVDDLGHRDRWPAAWRTVAATPDIVVLAGP